MRNAVDTVIGYFAPEAGHRRAQARIRTAALMNYDGASKGRRTYGWKAPATAADAAGMYARAQLRNLARDMVRNRALATRAREVVVGAVVGSGIMPSVNLDGPDDDALKLAVEAVIRQHLLTPAIDALGECSLPALQEIVMGTVFTDGEVLVRRRYRDPRFNPGLRLPFQVELLEADFLNTTIQSNGGNQVIEGVEIGPTGRVEAYHLYNQHPGAVVMGRTLATTRVPAADILHVRRLQRPGQLRGVSWLAPVMMTLGEISDYQEAQILKQRMAALVAGVIESDIEQTMPDAKALDDLSPGALVNLPPGSRVNWTTPPKVDGYGEFMAEGIGAIAMGIGITRESLSGNLRGVNYSSGRMGHMVQDRNVQMWQQNLMIAQFCDGIARWVQEGWGLLPGLPRARFGLDWTAPRRPLIDPTKEIPAMIEEIDAGLSSRQRKQRELGLDPDVVRRERVADAKADAAARLPPPVAKAAAKPGPVPMPDDEDADPEEQEEDEDE